MAKKNKSLNEQVETEIVTSAEMLDGGLEAKVEKTVDKLKARQKSYTMDLRIHSPASLGYLGIEGIDTAPALVRLAKVKGLDVIAVTDYNSGTFIDRIVEAARGTALTIIPGVVIRCSLGGCDDVILLCLFPETYTTTKIEEFLRRLQIPDRAFGNRKHSVKLPFDEILKTVEAFNGVVLPSRMDKTPYRQSVLPLLVEQYGFRAFDMAYSDSIRFFKAHWPKTKFQLFSFSNANALAQVGSRIAKVKMTIPGFEGIRQMVERQP
jgi:hypothetical protein